MRKVSRLMLATIAAIQGGAHSRRKVVYIRERAFLSSIYPIRHRDALILDTIRPSRVSEKWNPTDNLSLKSTSPSLVMVSTRDPYIYTYPEEHLELNKMGASSVFVTTYDPRVDVSDLDDIALSKMSVSGVSVRTSLIKNKAQDSIVLSSIKPKSIVVE